MGGGRVFSISFSKEILPLRDVGEAAVSSRLYDQRFPAIYCAIETNYSVFYLNLNNAI